MGGPSSALTAALSTGQSLPPPSPPQEQLEDVKPGAFPCLFQDASPPADAYEVELDLRRLSLRSHVLPRASLDDPEEGGGRSSWEKLGSPAMVQRFMGGSLGSSAPASSLPRPLPPASRRSFALDSPSPSPHVASFANITPTQLSARSAAGRSLRRRVLRGTVLVCLVAGYHGKRFIYERAKELGVRLVILDSRESWGRSLAEEGVIEKFVELDFSDEATVFERCLAAIKQIEAELGQVDGVLSFWELSQPLVARLAERLGLPGNPPAAVDAARDKQATRDAMRAAGLPTPACLAIRSAADLPRAAQAVGFPAVLKPTSGAASLGVIKVESAEDLERVYARACREVASVRACADGRLQAQPGEGEGEGTATDQASGGRFVAQTLLMEQYLDGPEVDVDLVLSGGEAVYGAVTDNWPTVEPYFNETGSNCPSLLPRASQAALCGLAVAAAKALGFECGVLHCELKATSRGPHLIEINARMGGGPVHLTNALVWGVCLVEEQLLASAGIPSRPYVARTPEHHVAEYSVNAKKSGTIQNFDFLQEYQQHPDVVYCRPLLPPGARVTAVQDGMPNWLFECLVTATNVRQAVAFVRSIEAALEPRIPIAERPRG